MREGPLDIFVLPHTHDDVGWLQTVFGYFNSSVTHILSSVTEALDSHPNYRFIWSETKWLELWWPLQNATTQAKFRKIVRNGQLEFVGAGWSQSDEVTPSYRDIIDNTVTGPTLTCTVALLDPSASLPSMPCLLLPGDRARVSAAHARRRLPKRALRALRLAN
jgi:hypothetical protein